MSAKNISYLLRKVQQRRVCVVPYDEQERLGVPDVQKMANEAAEKVGNRREINSPLSGGAASASPAAASSK